MEFLILTGLSGAGKTEALHALEDLGYFCVDNLPPMLIPKFAELCRESSGPIQRIALVIDIRGGEFFDNAVEALKTLEKMNISYQILFLEAADAALIRRFKETRRRHPLTAEGRISEGIARERQRLESLRGRAHRILDTSHLSPQELRRQIANLLEQEQALRRMVLNVVTFGFKHGLPLDADLVLDVRFLPNPYYVPSLRPKPGRNKAVREYVLKWPVTQQFLERVYELVDFLIPHYRTEGKSHLTVAIGCTGGRHRSVVIGDLIAEHLRETWPAASVEHRDLTRAGLEERVEWEEQ